MDSDALDTSLFCTSVHFSVEIGFCDGKDAVGWLHGVQAFDVILHFITQKRGHLNHAVTCDDSKERKEYIPWKRNKTSKTVLLNLSFSRTVLLVILESFSRSAGFEKLVSIQYHEPF